MSLIVPEHYHRYRVFSIDPGTLSLGLAVWDIDYASATVMSIEAGTLRPERLDYTDGVDDSFHGAQRRIEILARSLRWYIDRLQPVRIVYEAPFFNRRCPGAYGPLLSCVTMVESVVSSYGHIQTYGIPPILVKQAVNAKSVKGKEAMFAAVHENQFIRSRLITPFEQLDEHAIDALAIGLGDVLQYAR